MDKKADAIQDVLNIREGMLGRARTILKDLWNHNHYLEQHYSIEPEVREKLLREVLRLLTGEEAIRYVIECTGTYPPDAPVWSEDETKTLHRIGWL